MAYRAGIVGASGYSGAELLRLVAGHPQIQTVLATSREFAGRLVRDVYPNLAGLGDLAYSELDEDAAAGLDIVFLALPHGASATVGARLAARGTRVVDFSADFRLADPAAYARWYGAEHPEPSQLGRWVYGLPELHRDRIAGAQLVANPGCYPTAVLLALAPAVEAGLVDPATIVVSAASGVSGAGRGTSAGMHFPHVDGSFKAYGLGGHKHTPEIEQELGALSGTPAPVTFVPHLVPMPRGLLATCVATLAGDTPAAEVVAAYEARYAGEPFVRLVSSPPETKYTHGSNAAHVHVVVDERTGRLTALAAIDNLGKGAAGQALQNANLMLGVEETAGLTGGGVYP